MLRCHNLTLKEQSMIKSDATKRFAGYGFPKNDCTLQTSRTKNQRHTGHHCLSLIKSDTSKRFTSYCFLKGDCTWQTSRIIYKQDICTLMPSFHSLTLIDWFKFKSDTTETYQLMVFYRLSVHCKPLEPIVS